MSEGLTLTVGPVPDGRTIAIISEGGHPQRPDSGTCNILTIECVDGWSNRKIKTWYQRMKATKPWETRQ